MRTRLAGRDRNAHGEDVKVISIARTSKEEDDEEEAQASDPADSTASAAPAEEN